MDHAVIDGSNCRDDALLLGSDDPSPIESINSDSHYPAILVCEHAGSAIPSNLGNLGLAPHHLQSHIALDLGAEKLARRLAQQLGARLLLQPYSRLVIDCNRPPDAADFIPSVSDRVLIPANEELGADAKHRRQDEIFAPFDAGVSKALDAAHIKAAFSIHSFTPFMEGRHRPWDVGFCFQNDAATSDTMIARLRHSDESIRIGINQPYAVDPASDWFVPHQCEPRGLAHSLLEIRNDLLSTTQGCEYLSALLGDCITAVVEEGA